MGEEFEFEDYFSDDGDPGLLIEIEWDGRKVPFRIKRHLNLGDKQRIRAAGVNRMGKCDLIYIPDNLRLTVRTNAYLDPRCPDPLLVPPVEMPLDPKWNLAPVPLYLDE